MDQTNKPTIIQTKIDGAVGWITLNRPRELNPLSFELVRACREALREFSQADVAVVLITGAGRAFCAGADLNWLQSTLDRSVQDTSVAHHQMTAILEESHALISEMRAYPGVVVSLINGPAVGGGVGFALAADIVIASHSAYFSLPFVPNLGLIPDLGALWFMQSRIGSARAIALSLLGSPLSSQDALDAGLIWERVPDQDLPGHALELAAKLVELPSSAAIALKRLLAACNQPLDAYLAEERIGQADLFASEEARQAIAGFMEIHRKRSRS